jgi:hypothetical protein
MTTYVQYRCADLFIFQQILVQAGARGSVVG